MTGEHEDDVAMIALHVLATLDEADVPDPANRRAVFSVPLSE